MALTGSLPLRTYLPDGDIDVTVLPAPGSAPEKVRGGAPPMRIGASGERAWGRFPRSLCLLLPPQCANFARFLSLPVPNPLVRCAPLSICAYQLRDSWAERFKSFLESEDRNAEKAFPIKDVQVIHAEVKLLKVCQIFLPPFPRTLLLKGELGADGKGRLSILLTSPSAPCMRRNARAMWLDARRIKEGRGPLVHCITTSYNACFAVRGG